MSQPIQLKAVTPPERNVIRWSPGRRGFLLLALPLALACFAPSPAAQAVSPPPDGGYPSNNTAEGDNALLNLTNGEHNTANGFGALQNDTGGSFNTATGFQALLSNTTGGSNTATGENALLSNTTGGGNTATGDSALQNNNADNNTANGALALQQNTTGGGNTATGSDALLSNTTAMQNTANGSGALARNTTGSFNTATGFQALLSNTTAGANTANGFDALLKNTSGTQNTANGAAALQNNTTGNNNTATGLGALFGNTTGGNNMADGFDALASNTTGSGNIALGFNAGLNLTTGSNNIDIGNGGVAGEAAKIRIGTVGTQKATFIAGIRGVTVAGGVGVIVGSNGQLGTTTSSERFKDEIRPMDKASEAILALQPVTFRYKQELDPDGIPQFGLVAEQVEKVNPDLVARDADGKVNTVRYEAVNAMLLNEFLKEHRKIAEQDATITDLKSIIAQQQKEMAGFVADLKEQDSKIQKVRAQLELTKPAPQVVLNNQ